MSGRDNNSNNEEGWGSKFLKVASAAAATAAIASGLYALLSSSRVTEPQIPLEEADEDDHKIHTPTSSSQLQDTWTKPDLGWVKLNVDGSRVHEGPSAGAGCGGVFRDDSGDWLYGFSRNLDHITYQVHETEMKAILTGLELARKRMDLKKLVVESDLDSVVSMVVENANSNNPRSHPIIKSIKKLCDDPKWEVKVVSISRNANGVANRLARDACSLPRDRLLEYPSPPNNCVGLLLKDEQQGCVRF